MPHKDPDVKRAYHRAYKTLHADRLREQKRAYNQATRAQRYASWKAWCEANPEKRKAITSRARKRWEANNYEHLLDKNAKRRARLLDATVEQVDRLVVYRRDKGRCGICGRFTPRSSFDLDHIRPLARGGAHSYTNVQVSHSLCNRRKRATFEEPAA